MCHKKIRKRSLTTNLSHNNHNLLHSDKSTYNNAYFYNNKHKCKLLSNKRFLVSTVPLGLMALALLVVVSMLVCPIGGGLGLGGEEVYAVTAAETCESNEPVIALDMAGELNLSTNVDTDISNNAVSYLAKDFKVTSCRTKGYKVYVQADSSKLTNQQAPDALFGVGENVTPTNFADNTWGYAIAEPETDNATLSYNTMPEVEPTRTASYATDSSTGSAGQNLKITFAAKFGKDKTAGHYTNNVLLSVVANAWDVGTTWDELRYMQEMTPEICSQAVTDVNGDFNTKASTKQLIDKRDNKSYWVAKLKDGNCWMTQNLDLDLQEGVALTPEDSDVTANWTPGEGEGTIGENKLSTSTWTKSGIAVQSYDAGMYVYTKPEVAEGCDWRATSTNSCKNKGWVDVASMTASNSPSYGTEVTNDTYNAHYLIGNFYSWRAAAGGSEVDNTETDVDALASICPKGWRLPVSGRDSEKHPYNNDKSFANLLEKYGYEWDQAPTNSWSSYSGNYKVNGYNLTLRPFDMLYVGYIDQGSAKIVNTSIDTYYWSSTGVRQKGGAYYSRLIYINFVPAGTANYNAGFSVRCIAR